MKISNFSICSVPKKTTFAKIPFKVSIRISQNPEELLVIFIAIFVFVEMQSI